MKRWLDKLDIARMRFGTLAGTLSALVSYRFQPMIHGNTEALNTIVTVFSILAGFLVAVITIIGDGTQMGRGSWRRDEAAISSIRRKLTRHKLMFQVYLVVLALVFAIQLLGKDAEGMRWFEYTMLFLATFAFLGSLTLPGHLFHERIGKLESNREVPARLARALAGEEVDSRESEKK